MGVSGAPDAGFIDVDDLTLERLALPAYVGFITVVIGRGPLPGESIGPGHAGIGGDQAAFWNDIGIEIRDAEFAEGNEFDVEQVERNDQRQESSAFGDLLHVGLHADKAAFELRRSLAKKPG